MPHAVTLEYLYQQTRKKAQQMRSTIDAAELTIDDFEAVANCFDAKFTEDAMNVEADGHYSKDVAVITLNSHIRHDERRNFTFAHELMHHCIDQDNNLFELIADYAENASNEALDALVERLCNVGAAELLMPSDEVREIIAAREFTVALIPELCERFKASSIAAAIKLVTLAEHACYMFIAEKYKYEEDATQVRMLDSTPTQHWFLKVTYSAKSAAAKYPMGRGYEVLPEHLMYQSWAQPGEILTGHDDIPRRKSKNKPWKVDCECLAYRSKVFGFFHESSKHTNQDEQLGLFSS